MNINTDSAGRFTLADWATTKPDEFDLEAVYDECIAPLVEQVRAACNKHGIPSYMAFGVSNDGSTAHTATSFNVPRLDRLSPHLLSAQMLVGDDANLETSIKLAASITMRSNLFIRGRRVEASAS